MIERIFYEPADFESGLNVTIKFRDPNLVKRGPFVLIELENEGIYYLDYNFDLSGKWLSTIYENGKRIKSEVFNRVLPLGTVVYKGKK